MTAAIGFASNRDIGALKNLFRQTFGESEAGLDLFFSRVFAPSRTVAAKDGGTLCGAFYILPALLRTGGHSIPAAYLYALAVAPEFRSRGIAGQIMLFLDDVLPKMDFRAAILRPAEPSLFAYYRRFGFYEAFYIRHAEFTASEPGKVAPVPLAAIDRAAYFPDADPLFLWDKPMLNYTQSYLQIYGGAVYGVESGGDKGYAVCLPNGEVRELGGSSLLAGALCGTLGLQRIRVFLPASPADKRAVPYAMLKWFGPPCGGDNGYFALGLD